MFVLVTRHIINPAGGPRVAPRNAQGSEPDPNDDSAVLDSFESVGRTARVVTADVAIQRGDHRSISAQDKNADVAGQQPQERSERRHRRSPLASASINSARNCVQSRLPAPGSTRTTTSPSCGRAGNTSRPMARKRRRTRLRTTATPTVFGITKPNRVTPVPVTCTVRCAERSRLPPRIAARKSAPRATRLDLASMCEV
jgi:hypothetical protein